MILRVARQTATNVVWGLQLQWNAFTVFESRKRFASNINLKILHMNLPTFTDCGLNADWSVEALHYGTNRPNYDDGDLYVIENEARGTFDIVKYFPTREENRVECLLENITKQQRAKSIIHAHWHKNN